MAWLLVIVFGVLCVGWSRWFMPREMARIRTRMAQRGRSTARFDAIVEGSGYRFCMAWIGAAGIVAVIFGVVLAIE
jgi:hypothetical protein